MGGILSKMNKINKKTLFCFILSLLVFPLILFAAIVSSTFTGSENPLSESGVWVATVTATDTFDLVKKVSGDARASVGGGKDTLTTYDTAPANDQCSEVTLNAYTAGALNAISLLVRNTPDADFLAGYWGIFNDGNVIILENDGLGNNYVQDGSTGSATVGATDVLKMCIVGTTINVYQNGVSRVNATDATYASGKVGFGLAYGGGAAEADISIASWRGGDSADFTTTIPVFQHHRQQQRRH